MPHESSLVNWCTRVNSTLKINLVQTVLVCFSLYRKLSRSLWIIYWMEWILGREKMQGHTNRWFMRHRRKLFHYRHRTIFKAFCINWQMECTINIMRLIGEKSWPLLPSHFYPKSSGAENCIFYENEENTKI